MYNYEEIRSVHLELTERCQAACPMCPRTGNPLIQNHELSLKDIKDIFIPSFVKQLESIGLCGNFGEPIVAKDCLAIVEYFKETNPDIFITINTNAGARSEEWWQKLSSLLGNKGIVNFGIDGLEDTNHIYRVNVKWETAINNAKYFINAGGRARWDFIVFEHNEHQVEKAIELSDKIGFEKIRLKKTYRFKQYKDSNIRPPKNYFNENTDLVVKDDDYFDSVEIQCKVKEVKEIYISAQGLLFPCCWVGGEIYNKEHPLFEVAKIDLKTYSIKEIMDTNYFFETERKWKLASIKEGKPLTCAKFCGKNNRLLESQFS
jgi:MoaA/NifB/PqqE/SkfB family radical SAM enzyme